MRRNRKKKEKYMKREGIILEVSELQSFRKTEKEGREREKEKERHNWGHVSPRVPRQVNQVKDGAS